MLCIEVSLNKSEKFFLISCYRSPSGNFDSFIDDLNTLLESLNRFKKHKSFIFGDLNVNLYNMSCTYLLEEVSSIIRVACTKELPLMSYHLSPMFAVSCQLSDLIKHNVWISCKQCCVLQDTFQPGFSWTPT